MPVFKWVVFWAVLAVAVGAQLLPVSNCLGNCLGCAVTAPSVCLNQVRQDTGQTGRCVPFYDTHNCSTGSSFYVVIG